MKTPVVYTLFFARKFKRKKPQGLLAIRALMAYIIKNFCLSAFLLILNTGRKSYGKQDSMGNGNEKRSGKSRGRAKTGFS